jgi:hypothetical protein
MTRQHYIVGAPTLQRSLTPVGSIRSSAGWASHRTLGDPARFASLVHDLMRFDRQLGGKPSMWTATAESQSLRVGSDSFRVMRRIDTSDTMRQLIQHQTDSCAISALSYSSLLGMPSPAGKWGSYAYCGLYHVTGHFSPQSDGDSQGTPQHRQC